MSDPSEAAITGQVRAFYEDMPFNYYTTAEDASQKVAENPIRAYPDLDALLSEDVTLRVLEIGCGAGWATNAIALNYNRHVTAVDMTEKALARARDVSRLIGTEARTTFVQSDLFEFRSQDRYDLVLSIGVLHHTYDCRKAFDHVCSFVDRGGFLFVGLYHLAGRRVFLKMFQDILDRDGEEAAFQRFAAINQPTRDETHLRSWFRDQVLHPNETQHSLEEVMVWLDENDLTLVSTSINGYGDVDDHQALIEDEAAYEALSESRNGDENSFFPGFFTILAQRAG
jgi:cyclopropane fatty-acyl-phospholipid synthase-like methyltransferase